MTSLLPNDPLWYKDVIIYQVHIKSFFDSNDDGFGDFPGLIEKLDYLADLGVNCLWVLPFYPSPLKDDGYDIADYESINPMYGDIRDFRSFVKEAHRRGIRVITELVINHTSDQHPWFQAARQAPANSARRNFYVWSESDQKYPEARIIFIDYEKSNWTWDPVANAFFWHRFYHHQPDLNFDNPAVLKAVSDVMRFWLDMGVDGMRLDAIPYLIERDETNCENLPETHEVLKKLRAVMDNDYEGRVFLAEANQWPSDVRPYFGEGDECHMAFHFPVMPRLFMALHQEDRHPITEILNQTPEIPPNCQWAMFLRNHDELTLEMVTDAERDYMYKAYAHDPMMRINLGIRRRLAPLLQYSRARIELLNSILFSMPGTPIIYYGDEIGMGDNIFLGDRHGVRTPMQWSADRNGGFSRAFFAKLYSPPNMDPITGYQSINVEAQQLDPSSLLNWMRSLIKLRKQYKVFGRGELKILYPDNRKVLAYLRVQEGEKVLVVANLSRYPQSCQLDLHDFDGVTPVEMFGLVPFHPVTAEPYTLTLGSYGFFWLLLESPKPLPVVTPQQQSAEEKTADLPAVLHMHEFDLALGWKALLASPFREVMEKRLLSDHITRQRWFGKKTKRVVSTRIVDWAEIPGSTGAVFVVELSYAGGGTDLYSVFACIAYGSAAEEVTVDAPETIFVTAKYEKGAGIIYDALDNDDFCAALLNVLAQNKRIPGEAGYLEGFTGPTFAKHKLPTIEIKRVRSEQTNSSLLIGEQGQRPTFVLKLFRHLEPGVNPDYEICRHLHNIDGFEHVPAVAGLVEYRPMDQPEFFTFALMQEFVTNQGDGWTYTVDEFRRFYDRAHTNVSLLEKVSTTKKIQQLLDQDIPAEMYELLGVYLKDANTLGRRTGELHAALAAQVKPQAFQPEVMTKDDLIEFSFAIKKSIDKTLSHLDRQIASLPEEVRPAATKLRSMKPTILRFIDRMPMIRSKVLKIRCHGDFHLGQTLYNNGDFIIFDFEGEPAKPLAERRQKSSPLRDVAGMLRSFSYAAYASLFLFTHNRPDDYTRLLPWLKALEIWVSVSFLNGYLGAAHAHNFVPRDRDDFFRLLLPFVVDKAFYEIVYELDNRPDWIRVPINSLLDYLQENVIDNDS
ncbi:MAG TPA: maltose alpha-D-glucosyltransferase [Trichormus sp.]|jgi:maltose alpha-D-glucosyltransferase/alpha-amylase